MIKFSILLVILINFTFAHEDDVKCFACGPRQEGEFTIYSGNCKDENEKGKY